MSDPGELLHVYTLDTLHDDLLMYEEIIRYNINHPHTLFRIKKKNTYINLHIDDCLPIVYDCYDRLLFIIHYLYKCAERLNAKIIIRLNMQT